MNVGFRNRAEYDVHNRKHISLVDDCLLDVRE